MWSCMAGIFCKRFFVFFFAVSRRQPDKPLRRMLPWGFLVYFLKNIYNFIGNKFPLQ